MFAKLCALKTSSPPPRYSSQITFLSPSIALPSRHPSPLPPHRSSPLPSCRHRAPLPPSLLVDCCLFTPPADRGGLGTSRPLLPLVRCRPPCHRLFILFLICRLVVVSTPLPLVRSRLLSAVVVLAAAPTSSFLAVQSIPLTSPPLLSSSPLPPPLLPPPSPTSLMSLLLMIWRLLGSVGKGTGRGRGGASAMVVICYEEMWRGAKKKKIARGRAGVGGKILVPVSTCNPTGAFWGQRMDFCPQTLGKSPQTLPGQKWGKSRVCLSVAL